MSAKRRDKSEKPHETDNRPESSSVAQSSSSRKNQVYHTVNFGLDALGNISEGSDVLAPLKAACRATKSVLDIMQAIESNQEEWTNLTQRLKGYMSGLEKQTTLFKAYAANDRAFDEALRQPLMDYFKALEDIHDTVVEVREKRSRSKLGFLKSMSKVKIDAGEIRELNRDIEDRHRQFMEALGIFTALRAQGIQQKIETATILQLPTVAFAASSVHTTCLKGTREAVLQMIWRWASEVPSEKPIFWLCDIAGSGKSTVAMSAVESWRNEGVLGGRFFFSMANNDASTTDKFCSTIARDLVQYIPDLRPHIAKAVEQNPSFMRSSVDEQLRTLITNPLLQSDKRVILVIDAIDECKSGSQRRELLEALATAARECANLKIFLTSRPDPVIEAVLQGLLIKEKLENRLHDVKHPDTTNDIAVYVHHSLHEVLPQDKRPRLAEKANGLFIWASTACRMLTSETRLSSAEDVYDRLISLDQPGVIDDLYNLVFERTDPEYYAVMCSMLALLHGAFEPLTVDDLDDLVKHAKVRGSARALVQNLGSVLSVDSKTDLIQFRHPTLVEYLRRCSIPRGGDNRNKLHIDIGNAHGQTASWCLKRFKLPIGGLKFNICEIESSFFLNRQIPDLEERISKFIPRRLRYAGLHWLFHLAETDDGWRTRLKDGIEHVIKSPYVLYWMEVLSFTGGVPRAIAGLRAVARHKRIEEETRTMMTEVRRFLMAFSVPIQDSAPHIYISALAFSPRKSILHSERLKRHANTLNVTQGYEETYPGLPRALRGHGGRVYTVGTSPDGSRILSGSGHKTIRLWDAETGQPLGEPLRGHEDCVTAVAFSPSGSRIVSGSRDGTIRRWEADNGQSLGEPLRGHEGAVLAVGFSSDGSRIVSGSEDKTIRLWDADTGQPLGGPLRRHEQDVFAVAFSPDGFRIVSGSRDRLIQLWDAENGQPLGEPLEGHEFWVMAVGFSPDGSRIVSGSHDKTVRLWDAETGQPLGEPLQGHEGHVNAVAFLPDGSRIVSGSFDGTIRLWDAENAQPLGELLRDYDSSVVALAFSSDRSQIVSGTRGKTIQLWDAATGQPLGEPLRGHEDCVMAVAFSPDGSRIVSGSQDKTIRQWDATTGQPVGLPLRGHADRVSTVRFSRDGSKILSGSSDNVIRLWDAESGQPLGEPVRGPQGPQPAPSIVSISPDGSRVVSGSLMAPFQLWDADTGQAVGEPLRGYQGWVSAVAFSPDGSRIVSVSSDSTIRLWDAETGHPLGEPLKGRGAPLIVASLSPDNSRIVSGSYDGTIQLWDANTGEPLGELFGVMKGTSVLSYSRLTACALLLARSIRRFVCGIQRLLQALETRITEIMRLQALTPRTNLEVSF